jgi:LuxR family maltose regulon positive regulatory protein
MEQLLTTKLYIPPPRPNLVPRPNLIEQLNQGVTRKLILICAPAGFGKTTLLSDWVGKSDLPAAWLSLDKGDNEHSQFLIYFIAALQTIDDSLGKTTQAILQSPQAPPVESMLTALINEIAELPQDFVLIIDDYHVVEDITIHEALTFLIEHLPPLMHLVISSRSDPFLPLSRLRARSEMTELRTEDLRFSTIEATVFLNQMMGLSLSESDILSLESRTEGWIVGLQLAAISLQGKDNTSDLIKSFSGSHRIILDYLIDEVLEQQAEDIQSFLLKTAILERMTGPLCDVLTGHNDGQQTLEYLEQTNLFIIPLDNERCWYRYHHLFTDLLRVRLNQSIARDDIESMTELNMRASEWYEDNGLVIEAFQHAAAANDIERAERLVAGEGVPLQYRGASILVRNWLESLPATELDDRPSLWVTYASALNLTGRAPEAEEKLQAAEAALKNAEPGDKTNDIIGQIAAIRAMIAVGQHDLDTIIVQSRRALEYLNPDNLTLRTIASWTLGYTYQLQGDRDAASQAYTEVLSSSQSSGDIISTLAATTGLGNIQESRNQLYLAEESYQRGLELFSDPPQPVACGVYLGLAGMYYEWNELEAAQQYGQLSLQLAQQVENLDTPALSYILLARLKLAQGDTASAFKLITDAEQFVYQHNFVHREPEVATSKVLALLHQDDLAGAARLAEKHALPISQARVFLAQGDTLSALAVLDQYRQQVEAKGVEAERLKVLVLQAVVLHEHGKREKAIQLLGEALAMAEPGGFIRSFVDEGPPMARLLNEVQNLRIAPHYVHRLLAVFLTKESERTELLKRGSPETELIDPLSERELEVLQLLNTELTGSEIAQELVIALSTFQSHTKSIYSKLNVNNRRAAVLKAESLHIL